MAIRKLCSYRNQSGSCPHYAVPNSSRCAVHTLTYNRQENARRNAHPRQSVYSDKRWKETRRVVFERDEYTCQVCGDVYPDHRGLVCDHINGIDYEDPFNPDLCRTLCLKDSGKADGGRASSQGKTD